MLGEISEKCEIHSNEAFGRYLKSREPIQAGQCVLQEQPLLIIACPSDIRCSNCYRYASNYCSKCLISPLCLGCNEHDTRDCERILAAANGNLDALKELRKHPDCYGILKCLLICENPQMLEFTAEFWKLEDHLEVRRGGSIWKDLDEKVVQPLLKSGLTSALTLPGGFNKAIDENLLQRLCAIIDVNAFEIRAPDRLALRGLFLKASLFSHDCDANLNVAVDTDYCVKIYANRDIQANEVLGHCYINALLGTIERQRMLKECKYFLCSCERCKDPIEFGTHISSFVCSRCTALHQEGFLVPEINENPVQKWKCNKCSYQLSLTQVENVIEKVKEEIFHAKDDLRRYEILLAKLSTILHRNHYLMIDIKQNIASILREIITTSPEKPGRRVYERKVRLCQELVIVLHSLQPGISRLKAIALYELATSSIVLYDQRFTDQEIDGSELLELLKQCEGMLRESSRMLLHEPTKSPEGQLVRDIFNDLKELQLKQEELQSQCDESNDPLPK